MEIGQIKMADLIKSLILDIVKINKLQKIFLEDAYDRLNSTEKDDLNCLINFCNDEGIDCLADAYNTIVLDTLKEQIYFKRHKKYRFSTFKDVAESVYFNQEYMKHYMYGLALTAFFWEQHRSIKNYFLSVLPKKCKGKYLEIGPGHGYFMAKAMSTTAYDSFSGIDISPTSLELTKKFLDSDIWGETKNFNLVLSDFLEVNFKDRYDAIVMGEVLEHVEEPISFLEKIKSLSDGDTFIFVTTCINAPAIDHIKLFRNVDEVNDLIVKAGLQILDIHLVPYNNLDIDGSQKLELPINIALVLKNK